MMVASVRQETATWFVRKFEDIDLELSKYAAVCDLDLLDGDVVHRVLRGDRTVCYSLGSDAFEKMRQLLIMHFLVRHEAVEAIGEEQTRGLLHDVIERLRARVALH
jgi:hypothetical protein